MFENFTQEARPVGLIILGFRAQGSAEINRLYVWGKPRRYKTTVKTTDVASNDERSTQARRSIACHESPQEAPSLPKPDGWKPSIQQAELLRPERLVVVFRWAELKQLTGNKLYRPEIFGSCGALLPRIKQNFKMMGHGFACRPAQTKLFHCSRVRPTFSGGSL